MKSSNKMNLNKARQQIIHIEGAGHKVCMYTDYHWLINGIDVCPTSKKYKKGNKVERYNDLYDLFPVEKKVAKYSKKDSEFFGFDWSQNDTVDVTAYTLSQKVARARENTYCLADKPTWLPTWIYKKIIKHLLIQKHYGK